MYYDLFLSYALISCFDGEPEGGADPGTNPAPSTQNDDDLPKPPEGFTPAQQKLFNDAVAKERHKYETKLRKELEKSEQAYQNLLASKNLTEQERRALEEALTTVQGQLRTKEQQLVHEKKQVEEQYRAKLEEAQNIAQAWESRFKQSTVMRELQDAAVANDAFRPEQIVTILRPMSKLVEETDGNGRGTGNYKVVVEFPDIDANTREPITTTRTPDEAVKRMKELPELYGNLFKSNVISGIGMHSSTGGMPIGQNGKLDLRRLAKDPELFRKTLKENPSAIFGT